MASPNPTVVSASVLPEVVKVHIMDDCGQVLLVRERGKKNDAHTTDGATSKWRKPPGWGLPGGKVEGTPEQMVEGIRYHLRKQGIDPRRFDACVAVARKRFAKFEHVYLTAIKEVLEETGHLVSPTRIDLWRRSDREVVWFVCARTVAYGFREGLDVHIEGRAWFPQTDLPDGTYKRAKDMVREVRKRQEGVSA